MPYKDPEKLRIHNAAYRAANHEKCREKERAYDAAHREQKLARWAANRAAHREECCEKERAYYAAHREQKLAQRAAYYAKNRERIYAKNRTYCAAHRANSVNHYCKWTCADAALVADHAIPDPQLRLLVGRTLQAVKSKRYGMKRDAVDTAVMVA